MSPINRLYGADNSQNAVILTISALPPEEVGAALREARRFGRERPLNIKIFCRKCGTRKPPKAPPS